MKTSILSLFTLVAACSEYEFNESANTTPHDEMQEVIDGNDEPEEEAPVCDRSPLPSETIDTNEECFTEIPQGTFNPTLEWSKNTWSVAPDVYSMMSTPLVASFTDDNGDGLIDQRDVPDLLVITYHPGTIRVMSGDGGGEILNITGYDIQGQGTPAIGDIDSDGFVEIVVCTSNTVMAFEHNGDFKWESESIASHIEQTADSPSIADMDGDGHPEIIAGRAILDHTGALLGAGQYGMGNSENEGTTSFAADLDLDGLMEVITGNAAYNIDGSTKWYNGELDGYVGAGNFDADPQIEVVTVRDSRVRLLDSNGDVIWSTLLSDPWVAMGGAPTIADVDKDGELEIGVAGHSNYTVLNADGSVLWERPTNDPSGSTSAVAFDLEGDGSIEIIYADKTNLWVFAGPDGSIKLQSDEHANNTWTEYPLVADIDGDGSVEIVIGHTWPLYGFSVFGDLDDSWMPGRKIWNQHAFHDSNINDDGTVPSTVQPTIGGFRAGTEDTSRFTDVPDLIVKLADVCEIECDQDRLVVRAQVGNQGLMDLTDVQLELWGSVSGSDALLGHTAVESISAGSLLESTVFEIDLRSIPSGSLSSLWVNATASNLDQEECDITNNQAYWDHIPCTD